MLDKMAIWLVENIGCIAVLTCIFFFMGLGGAIALLWSQWSMFIFAVATVVGIFCIFIGVFVIQITADAADLIYPDEFGQ